MISPVSNAHPIEPRQQHLVHPPAEVRPDPQAQTPPVQKSGHVSQDQVTLKSAGELDRDR
jgi:hypothetical protein